MASFEDAGREKRVPASLDVRECLPLDDAEFQMPEPKIRFATREDVPVILDFIRGLAHYEKLDNEVVATEELLAEWIFEKKKAEVLLAEKGGKAVGFALFFHNFSTFLGRAGIYLEDLYVLPEERGQGVGTALLKRLGELTLERGCGRLEWSCLDWNKPSIDFYCALGAKRMEEWTVHRLAGEDLEAFVRGK